MPACHFGILPSALKLPQMGLSLLEQNVSCRIRQPARGEAAAAPCPWVQPVARQKMYSQQEHAHRAHTYTPRIYVYTLPATQTTDRQHSEHPHKHRQHQCPHLLPPSVRQDRGSLVRMELWATWSSGRCPCSWQGGWNQMIFKVSSNPYHSMVLSYLHTYKWIPSAAVSRHSVCSEAVIWIPVSPVAGNPL